jgi:serine/threonine-protein kinase HipA
MARFNATAENEALVMKPAATVGLRVAPVEPRNVRRLHR